MRHREIALVTIATVTNVALLLVGRVVAQTTDKLAPCISYPQDSGQVINSAETPPATVSNSEPTTVAAPIILGHLALNELLPNPVGSDADGEFIELINNSAVPVETTGWKISDQHNHIFALPTTIVDAGQLVFYPVSVSKLTLANAGSTISLIDPTGVTADSRTYSSSKEGVAEAKDVDGVWVTTSTPTPGMPNVFSVAVPAAGTVAPSAPTTAEVLADTVAPAATPVAPTAVTTQEIAPTVVPATNLTASVLVPPLVTEAFPNPVGSDDTEWVELYNPNTEVFSLAGWKLDDADGGSTPYAFPKTFSLPPLTATIVARAVSGLTLNNDQDQARLIKPDGSVGSVLSFGQSIEGKTWSVFLDGHSEWTLPSPGVYPPPAALTMAAVSEDVGDAEKSNKVGLVENGPAPAANMTIAEAREAEIGTELTMTGVVAMVPGRINASTLVLIDDLGKGILIKSGQFSKKPVKVGDKLRVNGMATWSVLGPMVTAASAGVKKLSSNNGLALADAGKGELPEPPSSVQVSGRITKIMGTSWSMLSEAGEPIAITLAKMADKTGFKKGDQVTVAGVMMAKSSGLVLYAAPGGVAAKAVDVVAAKKEPVPTASTDKPRRLPWVVLVAGLLAGGAVWLMVRRHNRLVGQEMASLSLPEPVWTEQIR